MNIINENYQEKEDNEIKPFDKFLDNDMKDKLKRYVRLYPEYLVLKNRVKNWKMYLFADSHYIISENISLLLIRANLLASFLQQEFKYLNGNVYSITNYDEFLKQTRMFKKMLKDWDKTLQKLHSKVHRLERKEWQANKVFGFQYLLNKQLTK